MEVHAHPHTPRKKWIHYFWEFFMLFLAVFAGFLAENQREHLVEHQRERQYMKSMIEDLKTDTLELVKMYSNAETSIRNIDSMLLLLVNDNITHEAITKSFQFSFPALNNIPSVFNDRTIAQLKNSGSMRIIRNQKVNDALINYWTNIEIIRKTLDRHTAYRIKGRDLETRIFNLAEIFLKNNGSMSNSTNQVHLISYEPKLIKEYANTIAYCGVILKGNLDQIKEQYILASQLIELIKKEYHLK
jgi:hypothetical protein